MTLESRRQAFESKREQILKQYRPVQDIQPVIPVVAEKKLIVPKRDDLSVRLTTNDTVKKVADALRTQPPKWDEIFEGLDSQAAYALPTREIVGMIGDIHSNQVIANVKDGDLAEKIDFYNIPDDPYHSYSFKRTEIGSVVIFDNNGYEIGEHDFSFRTKGDRNKGEKDLPVVGEVRITGKRTSVSEPGRSRKYGFEDLVSPETIEKKLTPLKEVSDDKEEDDKQNFAYIAVTVPNVVISPFLSGEYKGPAETPPKTPESDFIDRGGTLVVLPFGLSEVRNNVDKYLKTDERS